MTICNIYLKKQSKSFHILGSMLITMGNN